VSDGDVLSAVEDELRHHLLYPGGALFSIGGDDDVVIAEQKVVPDGGVESVVMQLTRLSRPRDCWFARIFDDPLPCSPCFALDSGSRLPGRVLNFERTDR
jgi:hypothetical protein